MFQGKIRADFIKTLTEAIYILVDESKFKLTSDGVYGRTVDPAHVGMIDFKLKKEAFDEYECKEEAEIGVDLEKLKSALKVATKDELVGLSYDKEEGRLAISIGNLTRKIALLDVNEDPPLGMISLSIVSNSLLEVIDFIAKNLPKNNFINIMSQYYPVWKAVKNKKLSRNKVYIKDFNFYFSFTTIWYKFEVAKFFLQC